MDTELFISQACGWLVDGGDEHDVEALIDLPGIDWVQVKEMRDTGESLDIVYRGLGLAQYLDGDIELCCNRSVVKAVRRRKRTDNDIPFGQEK